MQWKIYVPVRGSVKVPHWGIITIQLDRLHVWSQPDGLYNLWKALQDDFHVSHSLHNAQSTKHNCNVSLGTWRKVMLCSPLLPLVLLIRTMMWHFKSWLKGILFLIHLLAKDCLFSCRWIYCTDNQCLKDFPYGTSSGASGLRVQHLLLCLSLGCVVPP